ncbi:hypothetical protein PR202_gb19424 [Eleusine coracana subsp. coracana]|uniref:Polyadenylate-binding protein n=1 Tax=Eleusine coracana subsp. coracana TaxID=191504 RepID=A0AAV5F883_ELECO|nr:hypothetical protein PR202_gb19424 [Eleusine coracana subsp. coracana]
MAEAPAHAPAAAAEQEDSTTTTTTPAVAPAETTQAQQPPAAAVPALYVGDLHENATDEDLFDAFSKVGTVTSVRLCRDNATSRSLRYGYVNYFSRADAISALERLNHSLVLGKPIRVMWSNRDPDARRSGVGNVFVKNLSDSVDNASLQELFSKFGDVISCKIIRNEDGKRRGYGFVQFASQEPADAAIESLNNSYFGDRQLHVASFIKKSERSANNDDSYTNLYMKNLDDDMTEELIKLKFSQFGSIGSNIYIKNIHDEVDDNALRARFDEFGNIISAKVMRDDRGISRGFGFVCFSTPEEAKNAVSSMRGVMFYGKPLYVALAQRKEDRQAILHQHFTQLARMVAGSANSMIPTGYPHVYFAHPSAHIPQGPPRHGFIVLFLLHLYRTFEFKQRFSHPKYFSNDVVANGLAIHHGDPVPSMNNAEMSEQQMVLGNKLYPLVKRQQPELAGKITGMLIQQESNAVAMISSPELLYAKVEECAQLLQATKKAEDQEALHPGFMLDSASVNAN